MAIWTAFLAVLVAFGGLFDVIVEALQGFAT